MYRGNPKSKNTIVLLVLAILLVSMLTGCTPENTDSSQYPENDPVATTVTSATEDMDAPIIETFPELDAPVPFSISYSEYLEMSPEMQQAYYENFESPEAFYNWFDSAKAEYEDSDNPVESIPTETTNGGFFGDEAVEDWD